MKRNDNLVVGLDIGTTKICAVIGEAGPDGVDIIGVGTHPSDGLRKGHVVNIDATVSSIKKAIEEAEIMAGCEIMDVYTGIAGGHINSFDSHGMIAIKDKEISENDIKRVIDQARTVAIGLDREVIHILPQEFIIDGQDGIKEPLGMSGVRLEAKVHMVTGAVSSAQNIIKCANKSALNVMDIVLQSLASSEAVLSAEEKEVGVCIVDIGGGTIDMATFYEGSVKHTAEICLGGTHLTKDLAVGLRTSPNEAEKIKKKYGCAMVSMVGKDEMVEVPGVGGRKPKVISRATLAEIIEPRIEEMLTLINEEMKKSGFKEMMASGVVLTGGTALLEGIVELSENIFDLPVRRGLPTKVGGLIDVVNSPAYATGVGLVIYGSKNDRGVSRFKMRDDHIFGKVKHRMMEWFKEFF